jgi:hypothetical protein
MRLNLKALGFIFILSVIINSSVMAQGYNEVKTNAGARKAGAATLTARLIDAENKAKKKAATVEVTVKGCALIDPATVGEKPKAGQGHLHYRVDDGPVIATTATKLSFHELTSGTHKIVVMLAANDHSPLGPQETLTVTVP